MSRDHRSREKDIFPTPPNLPVRVITPEHTKLGSNQDKIMTELDVRDALWQDILAANKRGDLVVIDVVKGAFERLGHIIEELAPAAHRSIVISAKTADRIKGIQANYVQSPDENSLFLGLQPGNPNIVIWKPKKAKYDSYEKELFELYGYADVNTLHANPGHYILLRENESPLKLEGVGNKVTYIVSIYAPYTQAAEQEKKDRRNIALSHGWTHINEGRHASGHTPIVPKNHPLSSQAALAGLRKARAHYVIMIHGEHPEKAARIIKADYVDSFTEVVHKQSRPLTRVVLYDPENPGKIKQIR